MRGSMGKRITWGAGWAALTLAMLLWAVPGWAFPPIQHWVLANGTRVYFVPAPGLPMVDLRVVFDAGSARDGAHPGLAQLTNGLLEDGAGDLNADQVATLLDGLGAQFSSGALRDMAWVSLRSLAQARSLNEAAGLVARILGQPSFTETDFKRERSRMRVALRQQEQSLGSVAQRVFYRALYRNHPYADPPEGTLASVPTLSRAEVRGFYRRYYVGRNAVVAIVGALDRHQAEALAQRAAGALPAGAPAPALPAVPALGASRTVDVHRDSSQTHVLMGAPGMTRTDPDYFPLYVGNHILGGGGLVSRLSEDIREKRGLSYSVYSYFLPMRRKGPFLMGLQTRNGQTAEAVALLHADLRRFVADGPTAAELQAAKKNITGGFPLQIDSNQDIVGYLAMIGFYGLPLDYLETFTKKVEAVTKAQIRAAFRRRVDAGRLVTVIVGGGATRPGVKAVGG
ncbi:MAG TPA: pitrilysin family protein [Gammaproteobacteria bacterium]|nr:pitrilysin family protein [Gammaproteobacteria bacterium]